MEENIRTYVRFRPTLNEGETAVFDIQGHCISTAKGTFSFDNVFDTDATQLDIYKSIGEKLVKHVISGYNSCIFAYGQSNSGKSFNTFNIINESDYGLVPRCLVAIFNALNGNPKLLNSSVKLSFLEIYLENIRDLFSTEKEFLKLREHKTKGVYVEGLIQRDIRSANEGIRQILQALNNRMSASTKLNDTSSRSHAVITIYIEQEFAEETLSSRLNLCDLCGSEDVRKSEVTGLNLIEAQKINQSLSALGNVISALTEKNRSHIPYRDSKLTFFLSQSIGGNSQTAVLSCATKQAIHYADTINTLKFTSRVKLIKNQPTINKYESIKMLKEKIETLEAELAELKDYKNQVEVVERSDLDSVKLNYYQRKMERMERKIVAQAHDLAEIEHLYNNQREHAQSVSDRLYEEQLLGIKLKIENDVLKQFYFNLKASDGNDRILGCIVKKFELVELE